MIFNKVIEQSTSNNCTNFIFREAVRGIIIQNKQILLVHTNKGDYKFPGGGLEDNETHFQGLIREIKEETGYVNCRVHMKVGMICEKKVDVDDEKTLFQMISHYYLCELIDKEKINQQLEAYELAQKFTAKWVSLDDALKQNESLLNGVQNNEWLPRETFVLKELKKIYG